MYPTHSISNNNRSPGAHANQDTPSGTQVQEVKSMITIVENHEQDQIPPEKKLGGRAAEQSLNSTSNTLNGNPPPNTYLNDTINQIKTNKKLIIIENDEAREVWTGRIVGQSLKASNYDRSYNCRRQGTVEAVNSILDRDDHRLLHKLFQAGNIHSGTLFLKGTILHQAIFKKSLRCVRFLVNYRAKYRIPINARKGNLSGTSLNVTEIPPIEPAFCLAFNEKNFGILDALLSCKNEYDMEGININPIISMNINFDFNFPLDDQGRTALYYAVEQRCEHALEFFLEYSSQAISMKHINSALQLAESLCDSSAADFYGEARIAYVKIKNLLLTHLQKNKSKDL